MKRVLLLLLCVMLLDIHAIACANFATETVKSGAMTGSPSDRAQIVSLHSRMRRPDDPMEDKQAIAAKFQNSTNLTERNDYAVALMYLGRAAESVDKLLEIEKEKPGIYYTASNLGTAYELSGNNVEALRWIREGIKRNAESHDGTEWLHVKILEAKIENEKNPGYLPGHNISGADYARLKRESDKATEYVGRPVTVKELDKALHYQLKERVTFVGPPDMIVGSMLAEYAQTRSMVGGLRLTGHVLNLAGQYGYPSSKIAAMKSDFERLQKHWTKIHWAGLTLSGAGCLFLLYRHEQSKKTFSGQPLEVS